MASTGHKESAVCKQNRVQYAAQLASTGHNCEPGHVFEHSCSHSCVRTRKEGMLVICATASTTDRYTQSVSARPLRSVRVPRSTAIMHPCVCAVLCDCPLFTGVQINAAQWCFSGFMAGIQAFDTGTFQGIVFMIGGGVWSVLALYSMWVLKDVSGTHTQTHTHTRRHTWPTRKL